MSPLFSPTHIRHNFLPPHFPSLFVTSVGSKTPFRLVVSKVSLPCPIVWREIPVLSPTALRFFLFSKFLSWNQMTVPRIIHLHFPQFGPSLPPETEGAIYPQCLRSFFVIVPFFRVSVSPISNRAGSDFEWLPIAVRFFLVWLLPLMFISFLQQFQSHSDLPPA